MNTRKLLLLDNSTLRRLNQNLRAQLDAKHTLLYPPILFAEIAKDGLDEPKALFNFQNTVNVTYWVQRAKLELLEGVRPQTNFVGAKIPTTEISGYSDAERKKIVEEANDFVNYIIKEEERLKKHFSVLRESTSDFLILELVKNHKNIPDNKIARKFNQAIRKSRHVSHKYPLNAGAQLIGEGRKGIVKVRTTLDKYQDTYDMLYNVNTLESAQRWVEQIIYKDTKSILDFLCYRGAILQLSVNEQDKILNRFRRQGEPHINDFAPYAGAATLLYLTIFLYLVENEDNSSPKGALRDFEYLYYALASNVRFISGDKWHKRCIEEIPLLKDIQNSFMFLPNRKEDEKGFKEVIKSIGIKI